ncbi:hypothetical protein AS9A_P20039 (plasmid) [Hoyosella subflava DQS3-9A1]|uniref:Uncharacterized protein n=1 Tax=Hoyosella subflava (strain DSM 45089 / JCM 17490 / NBRC 109087 / DQS3-9A1) TaxID=443218 RepID=F6ESG2_HOYSD|nr:hypothetical protein AS9A_P20039 [Hoyosella subflava DQS3-9A1]
MSEFIRAAALTDWGFQGSVRPNLRPDGLTRSLWIIRGDKWH